MTRCLHGMPDATACTVCHPIKKARASRPVTSKQKQPGKGLPSVKGWLAFRDKVFAATTKLLCIHCWLPFMQVEGNAIYIGSRIRVWEDVWEVVDGQDIQVPRAKVVVMTLKGVACPDCNYLYIKAVAGEEASYQMRDAAYGVSLKDWRRRFIDLAGGSTAPVRYRAFLDVSEQVYEVMASLSPSTLKADATGTLITDSQVVDVRSAAFWAAYVARTGQAGGMRCVARGMGRLTSIVHIL